LARRDLTNPRGSTLPQHPSYLQWQGEWRKLLDVYEGAGGFLDVNRPYLAAHPREWLDHSIKVNAVGDEAGTTRWDVNPNPTHPSPKLKARRKIARYENIAATMLDQLKSALFRKPPDRTFADPDKIDEKHPLKAFWDNADGLGRPMSACIQDYWTAAGVFGFMILLADRNGDTPEETTPSQADAPPVVLRAYTPLDMPDWLIDDMGRLTAVRLLEAAPRSTFSDPLVDAGYQVREVDDTDWSVTVQAKAQAAAKQQQKVADVPKQPHGFGVLPVVMLYTKRRALTPLIGRSILGDPQLYVDHYNLLSEVRELLRNQTFAVLNIPIGERTGGVNAEMELVGQSAGTQNVLFSTLPAAYISPEGTNVEAYHEHIDRLVRTIYRLAVIAWESDSKNVESAESRQLKKEDLHQMLAAYAAECEDTETQIAKLVYRAHYGDSWETQWEADQPTIAYPDEFDITLLTQMIEDATAAMALELGETATKEMKKRVASELLSGASQATLEQVEKEIQALEVKTAEDLQRESMEMTFEHEQSMAEAKAPPA
jgi:hypothetical protein